LAGNFATDAEDSPTEIARLTTDRAADVASYDYAKITGPHGRIVWEYGSARD
jgi:hypothetical protein